MAPYLCFINKVLSLLVPRLIHDDVAGRDKSRLDETRTSRQESSATDCTRLLNNNFFVPDLLEDENVNKPRSSISTIAEGGYNNQILTRHGSLYSVRLSYNNL